MDLHFTPVQPQNVAYLWDFQHWLFGKCNWSKRWDWLKVYRLIHMYWLGYLNNRKWNTKIFQSSEGGGSFSENETNWVCTSSTDVGCAGDIMWQCDMHLFPSMSPVFSLLASTSAFEHLLCLKAICRHTMRSLLQTIWMIIKISDAWWPVSMWAGRVNTKP